MKYRVFLLVAGIAIAGCGSTTVENKFVPNFENCLGSKIYIADSTEALFLKKRLEELFELFRNYPSFWIPDWKCTIDDSTEIVSAAFVTSSESKRFIHTIFALLNSNQDLIGSIEIACPFYDDVGSALIFAVKGRKILVNCSSSGSTGLLGGIRQHNYEFHVLNFENFSEELAWRKTVIDRNGGRSTEELVDRALGLPAEFQVEIKKFMDLSEKSN